MGGQGLFQFKVHGIPIHAEHLAGHRLDGPVRGAEGVLVDTELDEQGVVETHAVHGTRGAADHLGGRFPDRRAHQRNARAAQQGTAQEIAPVHVLCFSHYSLRLR